MNRDDIRKLVGGYATGTLSDAERAQLMEAALEDQDIFDALADEQALKELLDEPGVRQRLAESLAPAKAPKPLSWWMRPWPVSALGAVALGLLVTVAALRTPEPREIAAVIPAPAQDAAQETSARQVAEAPTAAPAAPAKTSPVAPRANSAAPAPVEEPLKKDSGPGAPAQSNESDRKEKVQVQVQTLADAVQPQPVQAPLQQQQGQLQPQPPPPPPAPQQQQQQAFGQGQQSSKVAEAEQRRDQLAAAATQNSPSPPAAAPKPLARKAAGVAGAVVAPAFTWTIENGILRVTPGRDGALRIEAVPGAPMVVPNARRGVVTEFAIPVDAASVVVTFGAPGASADARGRAGNQRANSSVGGFVSMPAGAPNGPVSVEIPLK